MPKQEAFSWQHAILLSDLEPVTRHALLTLACYMNGYGNCCGATIALLAEGSGLPEDIIVDHLNRAQHAGYLEMRDGNFYQREPDGV